MKTSGLSKLIAAFLIGIAVAFAGLVLFDKLRPKAPVETTSVSEPAAPAPLPSATEASPVQPETVARSTQAQNPKAPKLTARATHTHPQHLAEEVAPAPQEEPASSANPYVTSGPPAAPVPQPASAPAAPQPEAAPVQVESPAPPKREPHTITIPAGTSVVVRVVQKLSSEENNAGDNFRATLALPIVSNGFVIVDKGSEVTGHVVAATKAGRVKGTSELSLQLTSLNTTDGQHVNIQTGLLTRQGSTSKRGDAAKVGAGAAIGAIIGAIAGGGKGAAIGAGVGGGAGAGDVLVTRGKSAVIESESELTFRLTDPLTLTEQIR